MLETIREFALEQLAASGELEATRRAWVAYYVDFAENAEREQFGPDMRQVWDGLADALDNIRAILRWCVDRSEAEPGLAHRWSAPDVVATMALNAVVA